MITREDVQHAAEKAVRDYGSDWVDPNAENINSFCQYTYRWSGSVKHCLAGHILAALGVPIPDVGDEGNNKTVINLIAGCNFTSDAIDDLAYLQRVQDRSLAWGKCYSTRYPDTDLTRELIESNADG